jgi:transcriptional regulator with XRE-family HTH domain
MKTSTFKSLRAMKRQTAQEVADKIDVELETYRKYERSDRIPSVQTVLKMLKAYECTTDELLDACGYHVGIKETKRKYKGVK